MSLSKFLQYLEFEKNYSLHTIKSYEKDLTDFVNYYFQETESEEIEKADKAHIRGFLIFLSKSSLSERTINRKLSSLRAYYKFLLKIGEIKTSPLAGIKSLKHYKEVQLPLSEEETKILFESKNIFKYDFLGLRDKLMLDLLYQTGMRRAELISLKVEDVDFSQKSLKVLGKRNKERIIPLSDKLLSEIQSYMDSREREYNAQTDVLFLTAKGKAFSDKLVYNLVNSYLSLVSTKHKKSPHILRHSFATHMLNRGADLNTVKELLGHSSLASTQVYTHGSIDELKKVFNQAHPREQKQKNYDNQSSDS